VWRVEKRAYPLLPYIVGRRHIFDLNSFLRMQFFEAGEDGFYRG